MSKDNQKKDFVFNRQVVDRLYEKYGLSEYYIKQSIRGRRKGEIPEKIKREYNLLVLKVEKAIKENS